MPCESIVHSMIVFRVGARHDALHHEIGALCPFFTLLLQHTSAAVLNDRNERDCRKR